VTFKVGDRVVLKVPGLHLDGIWSIKSLPLAAGSLYVLVGDDEESICVFAEDMQPAAGGRA
jgi:hypothetical protein